MTTKEQKLFKIAESYLDNERREYLKKALSISANFSEKSDKQTDYYNRGIDVAIIATQDIGLGLSVILSILLFRAYLHKKIDTHYIIEHFPDNFANQIIVILNGLLQIEKLDSQNVFRTYDGNFDKKYHTLSKRSKKFAKSEDDYLKKQGNYFKNLYVAVSKDIRCVLIRLAYHTWEISNIDNYPAGEQIVLSREARYLYAPIAHQLGLYKVKTLLEETAMRFLNPEIYNEIVAKLSGSKSLRDKYIEDFIKPIRKSIETLGYKAVIKGRSKSITSIWNKIVKKGVGLDGIYDLYAIRIILTDEFTEQKQEKSACWNVYSKITDVWTPNSKRLRDWISSPKSSGYESLHATVIGPNNKWVEVQIRTQRMDYIAEEGSAAHWRYKEIKGNKGHQDWLNKIREVLENQNSDDEDLAMSNDFYSNTIFVFTPKGEVKKFKHGATVLDFAYKIHSKVGNHCIGARINNKHAGIRQVLKNGDTIEIFTSQTQKPKQDWLDFVVSTNAKTRIKRALKEFEREAIENGKKILSQLEEKTKLKFSLNNFELDDKSLNTLRKKYSIQKLDEFYKKLGTDELEITPQTLYDFFVKKEQHLEKKLEKVDLENLTKNQHEDYLILDENMSKVKYEYAKCCNPIPGDNVFAFVTATKGTKIHKLNCPNAPDLFKNYEYRILKASWKKEEVQDKFKVKLKIVSEPKSGVVAQISNIIAKQPHLDLFAINIEESNKVIFEGTIGVLVNGVKYVNEFINKVKAIPGIMEVHRIDNF